MLTLTLEFRSLYHLICNFPSRIGQAVEHPNMSTKSILDKMVTLYTRFRACATIILALIECMQVTYWVTHTLVVHETPVSSHEFIVTPCTVCSNKLIRLDYLGASSLSLSTFLGCAADFFKEQNNIIVFMGSLGRRLFFFSSASLSHSRRTPRLMQK